MAGRASKQAEAMSYETLRQKIFAIAQKDHPLMEDFIPFEVGTYWLIGQTLVRHAEELLESLAPDLRKQYGSSWHEPRRSLGCWEVGGSV